MQEAQRKAANKTAPTAAGETLSPPAGKAAARGGPPRRASLAALLLALAALYGQAFDRSVRPDPFAPDPPLFDWLLHGQPDPALQTLPLLPAGWGGTLVFRPATTAWLGRPLPDLATVADLPPGLAPPATQPLFPGFARCDQAGRLCWLALPLASDAADPTRLNRLLVSADGGASWRLHSDLPVQAATDGGIADYPAAVFLEDPAAGWLVMHSGQVFRYYPGTGGWQPTQALAEGQVFDLNGNLLSFLVPLGSVTEVAGAAPATIRLGLPADPWRGFEVLMPTGEADWFFIQADGTIGSRGAKSPASSADRLLPAGQFLTLWSFASALEPQGVTWAAGHGGTLLRFDISDHESRVVTATPVPTPTRAPLRSLAFDPFSGYGWASSGWGESGEAGGRPVILQTADGGANWQQLAYRARPAPWVLYLVLPALLVIGGVAGIGWWHHLRRGPDQPAGGIEDRGQTDRPIGWGDLDVLGLKARAKALSRLIRNMATAPPLTIAVTGPWGSGKSSLMNLVVGDLRRFGTRPVWFNAWHHQQEESLLAALLESVRSQSVPSIWSWEGLFFRLRLLWARSHRSLVYLLLLLGVLLLAVLAMVLFMQLPWAALGQALGDFLNPPAPGAAAGERPDLLRRLVDWLLPAGGATAEGTWWEGLGTLAGLSGVAALLPTLLKRLRVITAEPARLLADLGRGGSVAGFQDKLGFRHRFAEEFGLVCHQLRRGQGAGVVIVIDDLDRCSPANVMTVLEAVNFLVSAGECFVLLGIDYERVLHSIAATYKDSLYRLPEEPGQGAAKKLGDDAGELRAQAVRYLEKLVNIVVAVPGPSDGSTRKLLTGSDDEAPPEPPALARRRRWAGRLGGLVRGATDYAPAILLLGLLFVALLGIAQQVPSLLPPTPAPAPPAAATQAPPGQPDQPAPAPSGDLPAPPEQQPLALPDASVAGGDWALWALLAGALAVLGLLLLRRELAPPEQEVTDSAGFQRSLQAFAPVVHALNDTPRAVKRFQNNLRLLALLDRPAAEQPSWLERRLGVPEPPPPRATGALDDEDIVVISTTAATLQRAGLRGAALRQATAAFCGGVDVAEASAALRDSVRRYYGKRRRPSEAEVERYFDLAAATRPQA